MSAYSKSDLERIAKESGFIRDSLEKVVRLIDILIFFNANPILSRHLALKGGTAINLTVFNLPRLSIDIDLDFIKECEKEEMFEIRKLINHEILSYMFTQGYTLSPKNRNPLSLDSWTFIYSNAGSNKDNLKIEINYSMRNHLYTMVQAKTNVDFTSSIEIQTLAPLELFGSKIKALIERTAARDLYDVYNMINQSLFSGSELISLRKVVLFYLAVGGNNAPKTDFCFETIDNFNYPQIRAHLIPVLRKSEHFDFEKAKIEVKSFLIELMILNDREREFIEAFNKQSFCPELLFEDKAIIKRIKNHPMANWKTREKISDPRKS